MLSDVTIRAYLAAGTIQIDDPDTGAPCWDAARVQAASYDVTLGREFLVFKGYPAHEIDPRTDVAPLMKRITFGDGGYAQLPPLGFALATTRERIILPPHVEAVVAGKSSLGRLGLHVENAGYIDPGFRGQVTLELFNAAPLPIRLYPGMPIAQLRFGLLTRPSERPYRGKYVGQAGPTASRFHHNWTGTDWTGQ